MDEAQFRKWLKQTCASADPDKAFDDIKRTGRIDFRDNAGRKYNVVYASVHELFVVQW
ncbi:hypothetical protein [Pseudomonas syringae]|uniref:hypothetical protein n=1 Tax=Pseudomonas syringae TaxID=317 RepID=UPI0013E93956|nr:hypothetical protein [Pseudomonas syringae]